MKIEISNNVRSFDVGDERITETMMVELSHNEQIVFHDDNEFNYDFVKKDWGYYATSSINDRLKKNGFLTCLVSNKNNKIFLLVVKENSTNEFRYYLEKENMKIIRWLHDELVTSDGV